MKKVITAIVSLGLAVLLLLPAAMSTEAAGFSGGHRMSGHSYSTYHSTPNVTATSSFVRSRSSYRSGYRAPSRNVQRTPSQRPNTQAQPKSSGGFWKGAALFGAGTFLGSMFHPFGGGGYGAYGGGFSLTGLLVDIFLIVGIIWFVKRIFTRRRY